MPATGVSSSWELITASNSCGIFYFAWVIPALLFLAGFGIAYVPFLRHLELRFRRLFVIAGFLYVTGVLGFELVSGYVADVYPDEILVRGLLATLEDFFEMLGIIAFLYALMVYSEARLPYVEWATARSPLRDTSERA